MTGLPLIGGVAKPGSKNRSGLHRPKDDHFPTRREAVFPLVRHLALPPDIWEPACGEGHIAEVMGEYGYNVTATNLVDRGYGETGVDFLLETQRRAPVIVTNPPFSLDEEFVLHALELEVDIAVFFLRLKWLCGADRHRRIMGPTPPCLVLPIIERVTFYAGDTPEAEQPGWNTEDFAWFVWRRIKNRKYFIGAPTIHALSRDDGEQLDIFKADVPRIPGPKTGSTSGDTKPRNKRRSK